MRRAALPALLSVLAGCASPRAVDLAAMQPTDPAAWRVGEGELELLLVHGIPGSARDFRWLSHLLAEQARTIRLEMPGFGGTPLATGPSPGVEARARFVV